MSPAPLSKAAQAQREAARLRTGAFGNQPHADSGVVQSLASPRIIEGFNVVRNRLLHMPDGPVTYTADEMSDRRNHYGMPIVAIDQYVEAHRVAIVPTEGGDPPECSCGWTREEFDGQWIDLWQHIAEQGPFGEGQPWTADAKRSFPPRSFDSIAAHVGDPWLQTIYDTLPHEQRWQVSEFIAALPQLSDDEFIRAVRPVLRTHFTDKNDDAGWVLVPAFKKAGLARASAAGHLPNCIAANPFRQVEREVLADVGAIPGNVAPCVCVQPASPART